MEDPVLQNSVGGLNFLASKKKKIRVIREIRAKKEKSVILNNDNKESLTPWPTTPDCG